MPPQKYPQDIPRYSKTSKKYLKIYQHIQKISKKSQNIQNMLVWFGMVLKLPLGQNVAPMNTHEQPALKMMATGRSRGRLLSGNRGGCQEETKESAGTVVRDLGFVYVSSDPLICAQFTRSTSSI